MISQESIQLAQKIYTALSKKKFKDIEVLDVHTLTSLTDIFVIVIAENNRQTKALADEAEYILEEQNIFATRKEGYITATWILLDYENVIVHILCKEDAEFYGLDRLWRDATVLIME